MNYRVVFFKTMCLFEDRYAWKLPPFTEHYEYNFTSHYTLNNIHAEFKIYNTLYKIMRIMKIRQILKPR